MKQTNNAIKFLMAQYRAIFKHAYLKGLASAVIMTAGLAAGSSNAFAATENFGQAATDATKTVTITGTSSDDLSVSVEASSNNALLGTININGGTSNAITGSGSGKLNSDTSITGTIKLTGSKTALTFTNSGSAGDSLDAYLDSVSGDNGTELKVISTESGSTSLNVNTLSLDKATLTITSDTTAATVKGSTLALANATVVFSGDAAANAILDGTNLTATGKNKFDFTSGSGTIKAATAYENVTDGNAAGSVVNMPVAADQTAVFSLNSDSNNNRGIFHFAKGSDIDLQIGQDTITTSGAIFSITGNSNNSGSIVEIDSGVNLHSSLATGNANSAQPASISVSGGSATSKSELRIDGQVLTDFLTDSDDTGNTDNAGAILLKSNSILQVNSDKTVELGTNSDENLLKLNIFSGSDVASQGGKIVVSGTTTFKADNLQISSALGANLATKLSVEADDLTIGTADSNLASGAVNAFGVSGATVHNSLTVLAKAGTTFKTNTVGDLTFDGSYYKQDSNGFNTSNINPAQELFNLDTEVNGNVSINGGNWSNENDITLSTGGVLTIGSVESSDKFNSKVGSADLYKNDGKFSLVTLTGNLNLTSGSLNVTGKSGANAVLDITGATVPLGSSQQATITLAGASSYIANVDDATAVLDEKAGYGVLKVDGSKFLTNFVGSSAEIVLSGDGVLYVTNPDTGTYDFDKFQSGSAAAAGQVVFSGAGFVVVDGDLHLTTGKGVQDGSDAEKGKALNIGQGTIVVDNLTLENDYKVKKDESTTAYDSVIIESGTLVIHEGLDSANTSTEFLLGSGSKGANLTFTTDAGKAGSVGVDLTTNVDDTSSGSITFDGGDWTVQNIDLAHGAAGDKLTIADSETATSVTGNNLKASGSSDNVVVKAQGSATFATAQLTSSAVITVDGSLTLTGKKEIAEDDVAYNQGLAGVNLNGSTFTVNNGGVLTLGDAILAAEDQNTSGSISFKTENETTTATINSALDASYTVHQGSELVLDFSETTAKSIFGETGVNAAKAAALKNALFDNDADTKLSGVLNLGNAELDIQYGADLNGWHTVTWDNISEFAQITGGDVTTEKLKNTIVTEVKQGTNLSGQYAAIMVDSSHNTGASVNTDNDFGLHNAYEVNGQKYYIFKQETGGKISVLGLNSTAGDVTLAGGGLIGETKVAETLSIIGEGTTYVQGNLTTAGLNVSGELEVSGDTTVSDHANISSNAAFTTKNLTAKDSDVVVMGNATATDKLTLNGTSVLDVIGGTLSVKDATLAANSELNVGYEKLSTVSQDDPETIFDDTQSYGGNLEITGQLILNGGVLRLDPSYDRPAAFGAVNNLSDHVTVSTDTSDLKAGNLDGYVYIGQNSVLGIGVSSLDEVKTATANFMNGEALDKNDVGAVLYLNKQFNIDAGYGLTLTADSVENFAKYYNDNKKTSTLSLNSNTNPTISDTVFLGANTAILVSSEVAAQADTVQNGDKAVAIIGFDSTNSNQGYVVADGGELILAGNVRVSTYKVFDNAKIQYIDGTDYQVVEESQAEHYEDNINISTENGVLVGVVGTDGTTSLTLAKDARAKLAGASDPVYTSLVAYANGYNGDDPDNTDAKLYYGLDQNGNKNTAYNNDVLQYSISTGNGADTEHVARLGVYAGAAQAAISAGASTYEAVSGRMGVGAQNGSVVFADNGQGAGLWVTPIYKNHDSDGFDAQGLSYGADMDMYGVALGGDFTMANGLRVGAAFNVGSGDADGQGAGAGVSNDFDYYGFSVYGGYTLDKLSIVGDISYTVVDNDAEANTGLGKATTSLDTSNLSVGVTGQYTFNLNAVDVTPHAGLRYTYIDMDDYTVKVDGSEQARYAADSMSIFSIPVGVTFSKDIASGDWTIKPTFDLTLTANVGDDSMDGSVTWAGVDNLTTNLESEVIDNFTYGATLGVAAKTGNFSFGLGVNYTGASSADEYGVSANARFVF